MGVSEWIKRKIKIPYYQVRLCNSLGAAAALGMLESLHNRGNLVQGHLNILCTAKTQHYTGGVFRKV